MNTNEYVMLSPIEDFFYLVNNVVKGEPTVEDLILLLGTLVAFIAFILWSCFPVHHKDALLPVLQGPDKGGKDEEKYNQIPAEYDFQITTSKITGKSWKYRLDMDHPNLKAKIIGKAILFRGDVPPLVKFKNMEMSPLLVQVGNMEKLAASSNFKMTFSSTL